MYMIILRRISLETSKIKSYLSFSIRSGKIIFGVDNLFQAKHKPNLVLICSLQNEKVTNKIIKFCDSSNIAYIKLEQLILADLIGRDNCKVVGLLDNNLAEAIRNELKMGNN